MISILATVLFGCMFLCDSDIHCIEEESLLNYGTLQLNSMETVHPPPDSSSHLKTKDLHQLRTNMDPPKPYTRFLEPGYLSIINLLKSKELQGVNENNFEPGNNKLVKERYKRTINLPLYYGINNKYIKPIDESLVSNPGFLANINEVFAYDDPPNDNSAELNKTNIHERNINMDSNSTDNSNNNNTGIDDRMHGPRTIKDQYNNYIPNTEKVKDIRLMHALIPNINEQGGTQEHDKYEHSSEDTKYQNEVIVEIFGIPPPQFVDGLVTATENNSSSVPTSETGYKMTTMKPKEISTEVAKNGANAQTTSLDVYLIYSITFVISFSQL